MEKEVLKDHWQLDLEYALGHLGSMTIFVGILLALGKLISLL